MMSLVYILSFILFAATEGATSEDNATIAMETRVATLERVVGQLITGRWDTQPSDLQALKEGRGVVYCRSSRDATLLSVQI